MVTCFIERINWCSYTLNITFNMEYYEAIPYKKCLNDIFKSYNGFYCKRNKLWFIQCGLNIEILKQLPWLKVITRCENQTISIVCGENIKLFIPFDLNREVFKKLILLIEVVPIENDYCIKNQIITFKTSANEFIILRITRILEEYGYKSIVSGLID